ncbi:MAG: energy transducer TonB [Nitrospiraceae bacterium]|nr:energy transducer TonB [Nitrospiraceae bacterium]
MRDQTRAFSVSLGIHAMVFTCIMAAGMIVPKTRTVLLDFSIGNPLSAVPASARRPAPAQEHRPTKAFTPTADSEQVAPLKQEETKDLPQPSPHDSADTRQDVNPDSTNASASNNGAGEAAKAKYVAAEFTYIRDKIMKALTYPMVARKMGWSGKVTVSFTVREDGSVEEIGIVESSGFALLDNNAVETIKKCCPLPKPFVKTALLMPIVYRLQ